MKRAISEEKAKKRRRIALLDAWQALLPEDRRLVPLVDWMCALWCPDQAQGKYLVGPFRRLSDRGRECFIQQLTHAKRGNLLRWLGAE